MQIRCWLLHFAATISQSLFGNSFFLCSSATSTTGAKVGAWQEARRGHVWEAPGGRVGVVQGTSIFLAWTLMLRLAIVVNVGLEGFLWKMLMWIVEGCKVEGEVEGMRRWKRNR